MAGKLIGENMDCKALALIREARAILNDESKVSNSRELSITVTKLDEAILWRQRDIQLRAPPINISNQDSLMLSSRDCIELMRLLSITDESCGASVKIANFLNRNK